METSARIPGASLRTRFTVWSAPAALGVLYAQRLGTQGDAGVSTWKLITIALATWYVWVLFTPWVERLADRWPLRGGRLMHPLLHLAAAVGFTALQAIATAMASGLVGAVALSMVPKIVPEWFLVLLPAGVVVYGAVIAFRQGSVSRVRLAQRERHSEQLVLALRDAQLTALRAQLQPHFLFNTLTAITALVRDGETTRAASALEQLSALLRSALRASDHHEVMLREEIDRLRHYAHIEELRLGRTIGLAIDASPGAMDALVPAWILQPIVENSVRHGFRPRPDAGAIAIEAHVTHEQLVLSVSDDGEGLPTDWERRATSGYGLSNSRARLAVLHGESAHLDIANAGPRGVCVTITMPYRTAAA